MGSDDVDRVLRYTESLETAHQKMAKKAPFMLHLLYPGKADHVTGSSLGLVSTFLKQRQLLELCRKDMVLGGWLMSSPGHLRPI